MLPEVVFTEPVVNVPAGVFLEEIRRGADGAVTVVETLPLSLVGVRPGGEIVPAVGLQDVVVAGMLLDRAREAGLATQLPIAFSTKLV